jgi:hypothetical protein
LSGRTFVKIPFSTQAMVGQQLLHCAQYPRTFFTSFHATAIMDALLVLSQSSPRIEKRRSILGQ